MTLEGVGEGVFGLLGEAFYPSPEEIVIGKDSVEKVNHGLCFKVYYYTINIFKLAIACALLPFAGIITLANRKVDLFKTEEGAPLSEEEKATALPADFGFADSLFQSSLLGTDYSKPACKGVSDWNEWIKKGKVEVDPANPFSKVGINFLDNPKALIKMLKQMHVTAYRFSLERAALETAKGCYDMQLVRKYQNLCHLLKKNGIEPWVTLHHFVDPAWFAKEGGFEKQENIPGFVDFCEKMITFFPDVKHWMTFNEPGVYAFQKYVTGAYPHEKKGIGLGARVLANLLSAHVLVYKKVKALHPDIDVGITHQWLKFIPHGGNPIERLVCYFLSLITHYAVYNFFKTGYFSFSLPGIVNVKMKAEEKRLTDFIGIQVYGRVPLKIGFNGGIEYPGSCINLNLPRLGIGLTMGATCKKGGTVTSLGVPDDSDALKWALEEAKAVVDSGRAGKMAITETGRDRKCQFMYTKQLCIDEEGQKKYFEKVFEIIARFRSSLSAVFLWTLVFPQLEWEHGTKGPEMGVVHVVRDEKGKIVSSKLSEAGEYIRKIFSLGQTRAEVSIKAAS